MVTNGQELLHPDEGGQVLPRQRGFGSAELVDDDADASMLALDAARCKWTAQSWSSEPSARLLPSASKPARPVTYMRCFGARVSCSIEFCITL